MERPYRPLLFCSESPQERQNANAGLVHAHGQIYAVNFAQQARGHAALDSATLAMAQEAQPFPAIPTELARSRMTFKVPIQFKIE